LIALLQRVRQASVSIQSNNQAEIIASISQGLLVFVAFKNEDDEDKLISMFKKITQYRIFEDRMEKMNLSVNDIQGQLLIVPQFTLAADTKKGLRPGFSHAAPPKQGHHLFNQFCDIATHSSLTTKFGKFAADMDVQLINSGPATFWLEN